jgi:hypothetical protein
LARGGFEGPEVSLPTVARRCRESVADSGNDRVVSDTKAWNET